MCVEKPGENRREEWRGKTNDKGGNNVSRDESREMWRERTAPRTALLPTRSPPAPQARRCLGITRAWSQMILEGWGPLNSAQRSIQYREGLSQMHPLFTFAAYLSPCICF